MKEVVKFFWERWHRANTMDAASKLLGRPTHTWVVADEWVSAYKNTLSKNKQSEFDKVWNGLEKELSAFQNGVKGASNPLSI